MSRQVNGMHVSNYRHWHVEDLHRSTHSAGAVTILHFLMRDDHTQRQWSDRENINWYIKLRHGWQPQGIPAAPKRLIHVRMFHPHWSSRSAKEWARHTVDMLSHIEAADVNGHVYGTYNLWTDPYVTVSPANEQNLHYENGDPEPGNQWKYRTVEHYINIAKWNAEWAREVKRLVPQRKATLTWPALAYGHDPLAQAMDGTAVPEWAQYQIPDGEYQIPEIRAAVGEFEIMATHPYGHLDWPEPLATQTVTWGDENAYYHLYRDFRPKGFDNPGDPGGAFAQLPGKPFLITESGTFAHSDSHRKDQNIEVMEEFLRQSAQSKRVLGVTWFIWSSNDAHQDNDIMRCGDLRDAVTAFPRFETSLDVPLPAPLDGDGDEVPARRDEWILRQAEDLHKRSGLRLSAGSALLSVSGADLSAWTPTTNEHTAIFGGDGQSYTLQRFERPATADVKVVYFPTGKWDQPHEVLRGVIPPPEGRRHGYGIDVSRHNGRVNWASAAERGVDFAFIKATEGWSWIDPRFDENAAGSAGEIEYRGAYHYYSNTAGKPVSQARHFVDTIKAYDWELPPVIDIEDTNAPFKSADFKKFLEKVEELTGERPIIYSAKWYADGYSRKLADYVNDYWQWVASYSDKMQVPEGWENVVVWQYTSQGDGRAHGAAGSNLDLNRTVKKYRRSDLKNLKRRKPTAT